MEMMTPRAIVEQGRIAERIETDWMAFYERNNGAGYSNPIQDLSLTGGFLRTSRPLDPGAEVSLLLLSRHQAKYLQVPARVVWSGRKQAHRGMGLCFEHNHDSLAGLEQILEDLQSAPKA